MSLAQIVNAWNSFFFEELSPLPMAVFRIAVGLLVLLFAFQLCPDLTIWYGPNAIISQTTLARVSAWTKFNLLTLLPNDEFSVWVFFLIFVLAAFFLTVGFLSRTSAILVFAGMLSLHSSNTLILNSGDNLLRLLVLYLVFSPAGRALSIDNLIRRRFSKKSSTNVYSPVAQRIVQLQMIAIYCQAFWTKLVGVTWLDGTAMYYCSRLEEYWRFSVPQAIDHILVYQLLSWGTLVVEFSLWTLIWVRELRPFVLLLGIALHLGIEITMNVNFFSYIMLSCYITFLSDRQIKTALEWLKSGAFPTNNFRKPLLVSRERIETISPISHFEGLS